MIQPSTAPVATSWLPVPCKSSSSQSSRVSVAVGVISFLKALHPDYAAGSIQMELPTLCADPPEKSSHSLLQRAELATKVACVCAGLPADVVSCIGWGANFCAVARWLGSSLAALGAEKAVNRDDENHPQAQKKTWHRTTCHGQLPKTAIGLGAASCLGIVGAAPAPDHERWIEVTDSSVLEKIGRDPACPLNGNYRQRVDIDASDLSGPVGNESHPFVGKYDGGCHAIKKLRHCFIQKLDGNGRIGNVRFARADIDSMEKAGVVTCELSGRAALDNITVEHSELLTNGDNAPAGLGAGVVSRDALININGFSAFNCSTKTKGVHSHAGGVAGVAYGTIDNTRLRETVVKARGENSNVGGVAGVAYGVLNNTVIIDGNFITDKAEANVGGGAGMAGRGAVIDNMVLIATDLTTRGLGACLGGGAGVITSDALVANTLLINSTLQTRGDGADAGGGGGGVYGTVNNTAMVGGKVETSGEDAGSAVGAGYAPGKVVNTTGQRVLVRTKGLNADAAVGAGVAGVVKGVVCFGSDVETRKPNSDAGIGTGWLSGRAVDVVAYDCRVRAYGQRSNAGFGSGAVSSGNFSSLIVMNGSVHASGKSANESVNGGVSPFLCNASVGDGYKSLPCCNNFTGKPCRPIPEDACKLADRRVLTKDCRPVAPPYYDAKQGYDFVCPASPTPTAGVFNITTLSSTTSASKTTTSIAIAAPTTSITSIAAPTTSIATPTTSIATPTTSIATPTTSIATPATSIVTPTTSIATTQITNSQEPYVLTTPTLPVANGTSVTMANMTNSTIPSLVPVTSPVPVVLAAPVAAMSSGALAGSIVAGVVALGLVGVAGFALYRYCHKQNPMAEGGIFLKKLDDS